MVHNQKFASADSFAQAKGNIVPASHYGMPAGIPLELVVTVTFEDLGGKTRMTLRHAGFPVGLHRDMAGQGWSESFEKLAASLMEAPAGTEFVEDRGKRQVVMTRVFNASRDRLFRAYTDPKLIPRWWGPRRYR